MQKNISRLTATAALILSFSAMVWALATNMNVETFESTFIKKLKEKFNTFYDKTNQDRVYVQTDKTFYKPGETVWFTAYVRDEQTLKSSNNSDIIHVELITPKGAVETHYKLIANNGAAQGDFDLSGHTGGIYKIKAYTQWQKNEENALLFEKEITVQQSVMPRLKMKLDFEKKAYGKGDEVVAKLELNTNENKPLTNTTVKFKASLDGKELTEKSMVTDANGKVNLRFSLPKDLNSVDGIINAMIEFEGSTESVSRSIPIVLNKIKLDFFPEGGDMVSGISSRVAFRAVNEFGKPADVEGIIVDSKGAFVAKYSSYHFGMGAVSFVPKKDEVYRARITKPEGILDEFELPEALIIGYTIRTGEAQGNNLQLSVNSWQNEQLSLVAQVRGKVYHASSFNAVKGENQISISAKDFPVGVAQITLFDSKGIARSERLAFVNKHKQLKISVTTGKSQYKPRETVNMNIRVTDENGLPVPGNFSLSVVDDNLLAFADDKQGNILSKILLEPELKEKVEEANFYFDTKEAKANKALDLLMMTSGWRRYTWKQVSNEDLPPMNYTAEKAQLSGFVYDGNSSKPVQGALLKFQTSGRSVITDKDGKFFFNKFDITKDNQLDITATKYQKETQTVYNYGNATYYLYDTRYSRPYAIMNMMPMAAEGAVAEKAADAVKNKRGEIDQLERLDMAALPPDMAELPKKEEDIADEEIIDGDIDDRRMNEIVVFDKKVAGRIPQPDMYYRAKEFPKRKYTAADSTRNDFASTVYWNGNVETDGNGRAKVEFIANDLISSFKATLEGFGDDGSIGRTEYNFSTNLPFAMDAKIPVEVVSGDKMLIPVFLKNNTDEVINGKLLINTSKQIEATATQNEITLPPKGNKVIYLSCIASSEIGEGKLEIKFTSSQLNDAITRKINVVAKGFPVSVSLSGQDMQKDFAINPTNVVPGSMKVTFKAYPNIMGELMSGVESILREPYGCFEQTSSSNYPNIMVLQYLKTMQINDPKLEAKAKGLLDDGYKKLVTFETKENGYEWFGAEPAHEALTAYGLMEFQDMKKVYDGVDEKMIDRTVKLLLDKRDGNGGFKKNPRALDSFGGADEDVTNAYIVYALSEAGYKDLEKEMTAVYKSAKKSEDPYIMALCANALFNWGDKTRGEEMVNQIIRARNAAGFWTGSKHSITRSTGESLKVETTSLILLALMKSQNPNTEAITGAVKFLVGARSGYGGFGSTQATILALKSLTKYAEFSKRTDEAGTIEILVNSTVVATKNFAKGEQNNITVEGLEKFIRTGKQKIEVRYKGCKQPLPYAMNVAYSTTLPQSSKECVVSLNTKISATEVKVGETMRLSATLKNKTDKGQPMTMVIIGIPAGFSAQPWQLKEMQEKGVIDFYETVGNNIACYYRDLAPNAEKQINLDLKAEIPGEYDAPASSAYLYYTNEHKDWKGLERVSIRQSL